MEENDKEFDKLSSSSEEKKTETFNKVDERLIEYKKSR